MKIKLIDFGLEKGYEPCRKHYNDAGADCYAFEDVVIPPHETIKLGLKFGTEIPDGYTGFIFPRSGVSSKGVRPALSPIDSGYRGEIHAILTNFSDKPYEIKKYDRIGQLVILPVVLADFVYDLDNSRGAGAFGSTGR